MKILKHCAAKLPRFEVPGAILLVDSIPKTSHGKLDRAASAAVFLRSETKASSVIMGLEEKDHGRF
jgi:acyl-CoA synthetase (AMP-forming)/AMP-acid ligase II